ncbi:hypothetical protein AB2C32_31935, partial [Pseudomonas aeruginosa]
SPGSNHIHTYQLVRKNTFPHQKIQTGLADQQNRGVWFLMRKLFLTGEPIWRGSAQIRDCFTVHA